MFVSDTLSEEDDPEAIRDEEVNRYLREPMCVAEATATQVPQSLSRLYTSSAPSTPSEAVVIVIHQLMIETGFQVRNIICQQCRSAACYVPFD